MNLKHKYFQQAILLTCLGLFLSGNTFAAPKQKFVTLKQLNAILAAERTARTAADNAEAAVRQANDIALSAATSSSKHFIGEQYGGGIVFYVYDDGQHGLIAAKSDQNRGPGAEWGSDTISTRGDGIGAGAMNTAIIATGGGFTAAKVAAEFRIQEDGSSACTGATTEVCIGGWYLPSPIEMSLLYAQKDIVGGFDIQTPYWTSVSSVTVGPGSTAINIWFIDGHFRTGGKTMREHVRPIRAF